MPKRTNKTVAFRGHEFEVDHYADGDGVDRGIELWSEFLALDIEKNKSEAI